MMGTSLLCGFMTTSGQRTPFVLASFLLLKQYSNNLGQEGFTFYNLRSVIEGKSERWESEAVDPYPQLRAERNKCTLLFTCLRSAQFLHSYSLGSTPLRGLCHP